MVTQRKQIVICLKLEGKENRMHGSSSLGSFIAMRRKLMGLTQAELSDRVGVSKSAIAKWETDGGLPDRDNLKRLGEVMNVSVDELHRIIRNTATFGTEEVNITPEIITVLESYGYKVIRPWQGR